MLLAASFVSSILVLAFSAHHGGRVKGSIVSMVSADVEIVAVHFLDSNGARRRMS